MLFDDKDMEHKWAEEEQIANIISSLCDYLRAPCKLTLEKALDSMSCFCSTLEHKCCACKENNT